MMVERSTPTDTPREVLDRVLDKGIVVSASLRRHDGPIELTGHAGRIVAESDVYTDEEPKRSPRAA